MKLFRLFVSTLFVAAGFSNLHAVNVIVNGSFEDTNITGAGNHLNVSVPNWTITDSSNVDPNPTNLVIPSPGYFGGPDVAQDGTVYFDGNGTDVVLFQDFNISVDQTVTFSAYFSPRDNLSASGNVINIYDSNDVLVGSSNVVDIPDATTDPTSPETWYFSSGSAALVAGDYRLQINLPNDANLDNVILNVIPEPSVVTLFSLAGVGLFIARRRIVARRLSA